MKRIRIIGGIGLLGLYLYSCSSEIQPAEPETELPNEVVVDPNVLPVIEVLTDEPIQNEPKIPARIRILQSDVVQYEGNIGIEYRGSTSFRISDKKSYGIETWDENGQDLSVELLGMPAEEDWILMGQVFRAPNTLIDPTFMHHRLGYELYRSIGNYAARSKFVELELNGTYDGIYLFMEKLKRDTNRIDISSILPTDLTGEALTGGYVLKIDKATGTEAGIGQPLEYYESNWGDDAKYTEAISFRSDYGVDGSLLDFEPFGPPYHERQNIETYFLYEYPKASEIQEAQKQYISNYVHEFESALLREDGTYTDFVDLQSFVDYFLLNELVMNVDAYRISTFLYKDRSGPLVLGPVWDLNIGYDTRGNRVPDGGWVLDYNDYVSLNDAWLVPFWWDILFNDDAFRSLAKSRWTSIRSGAWSNQNILQKIEQDAKLLKDSGAVNRNFERWTGIEVNFDQSIENLKAFMEQRLSWMDQQIGSF